MKLRKFTGNMLIAAVSVLALSACKESAGTKNAEAKQAINAAPVTAAPSTPEEELSYSLGNIIGQRIKSDFENISIAQVNKGMDDALSGRKSVLTKEKMQSIIEKSQQEHMKKVQQKMKDEAAANLKRNEAFLKENGQKPGITTTSSGLQYKDITKSLTDEDKKSLLSYLKTKPVMDMSSTPGSESKVTVSYVGTFTDKDGKEHIFDASNKRKEPAKFAVSQVIKGWQEGLLLMHQGQTFQFFIPPKLAYGESGIPGVIPPNSLLDFKVTLLKVENGGMKKSLNKPSKKPSASEKKMEKPKSMKAEKSASMKNTGMKKPEKSSVEHKIEKSAEHAVEHKEPAAEHK